MVNQYAVGVDLHKKTSTWKVVNEERTVVWSKTVPVNENDIVVAIKSLPKASLPVALEPTCGWKWVSNVLEDNGLDVHIANPFKLRVIADSKHKTDNKDAKTLAEFMQLGFLPESWRAPREIDAIRDIVRTRQALVAMRTKVKNRMSSLLTAYGPGFDASGDHSFREMDSLVQELTIHIKNSDEAIARAAADNEICVLLRTIPGVGPLTALVVVAEVGDFSRFSHPSKLASFAGLVPSQRSSGQTLRYGHITKAGSRLLRTILIETAMRVREEHPLYVFLSRVAEKRGAMTARVAVARKLLTIMWSMAKHKTPFVPSHGTMKIG